jgi:hypothetical protein
VAFLTGTSERVYWPYGFEFNRSVEKSYHSGISWQPLSGLFFGVQILKTKDHDNAKSNFSLFYPWFGNKPGCPGKYTLKSSLPQRR